MTFLPRLGSLLAAVALAAPATAAPAALARVPEPDHDPFYAVPSDVGALADGAVIRSRRIVPVALSIPMPARAWQVLYKTVDNTGAPTATVTTIMVPLALWTGRGPRPVLSYQTAEDGAGTKCAPSYAIRAGLPAAASNSAPETLLMLQALQRGWTVVASDYEGPRSMFLGADGEARGVLDGLRATRAFAPARIDRSAPLALWGYSGGAGGVPAAPVYEYHSVADQPARALVERFCRAGVPVQHVEDRLSEHLTFTGLGAPGAFAYLAGRPAPSNCGAGPRAGR